MYIFKVLGAKSNFFFSWLWSHVPLTLTLRKQGQVDLCGFGGGLGDGVQWCICGSQKANCRNWFSPSWVSIASDPQAQPNLVLFNANYNVLLTNHIYK